jgi:hypothetical protein
MPILKMSKTLKLMGTFILVSGLDHTPPGAAAPQGACGGK